MKINEILGESERLRLRVANLGDVDYILELCYAPENRAYILAFDRVHHEGIVAGDGKEAVDVIVEEKAKGERVGYFLVAGLSTEAKEQEWTHVVVEKKGMGYGHEAMKILKRWAFDTWGAHRVWLDCKDYNTRALHLYESEGFQREGLIRETFYNAQKDVYENLVVLGILRAEYEAQKAGE